MTAQQSVTAQLMCAFLTVAIVVDAIFVSVGSSCARSIHLRRVHPQVVNQIRVQIIYASVNDADADLQETRT